MCCDTHCSPLMVQENITQTPEEAPPDEKEKKEQGKHRHRFRVGRRRLAHKVRAGTVKCQNEAGTDEPHLSFNPSDMMMSVNQRSDTKLFAELNQDQMTGIVLEGCNDRDLPTVSDHVQNAAGDIASESDFPEMCKDQGRTDGCEQDGSKEPP